MNLFKTLCLSLSALLLAACGGGSGGLPAQGGGDGGSVSEKQLTAIQLTPVNALIPTGLNQQYQAEAIFSDGSTTDVTSNAGARWSSSNTSVATIDEQGFALGLAPGTATISVEMDGATAPIVATAQLEVQDIGITSIQLTPVNALLPIGLEQQFIATATLTNGTTLDVTRNTRAQWDSSNPAIASVGNSGSGKGLALALAEGVTTITVSGIVDNKTFQASAQLAVSNATFTGLAVTPNPASVNVGLSQAFTALATFSDDRTLDVSQQSGLNWSSSDTSIATISNAGADKGLATGLSIGTTQIEANLTLAGRSITSQAELSVTGLQVTALRITPAQVSIITGATQPFTAIATLSDNSERDVTTDPALSWSSSNLDIATINSTGSDKGVATGIAPGVTTINAHGEANGQVFDATAELTVTIPYYSKIISWGMAARGGDNSAIADQVTLVKEVRSNMYAFAAIQKDGSVLTWGSGFAGGDSSTVQDQLVDVQEIVTNETSMAAIRADKRVITWGTAENGGDSSAVQDQLINVKSITKSLTAYAAIREDGSVVTWGMAANGGDSSAVQADLTDVQSITATNSAFAAIKGDGTVVSWGNGSTGGDSSAVQSELTDVKSLSATSNAFVALKGDGSVSVWGNKDGGGENAYYQSIKPQLIGVQSVVANDLAFAALKMDGTVVSWGYYLNGGDSRDIADQLVNVQSIVPGDDAFAALKGDGTAVSWGGSADSSTSPQKDNLVNIHTIVPNLRAFAGIKEDGTVVAWGDLGTGGDASAVQDQLVDVRSITAGGSAFAAMKKDGSVVTWGTSSLGGDSSAVQDQLFDIQQIAGGLSAMTALRP